MNFVINRRLIHAIQIANNQLLRKYGWLWLLQIRSSPF